MAIFNQQSSAKKDVPSFANNDAAPNPQAAQTPTPTPIRETPAAADFNPTQAAPPRAVAEAPAKASLIAADLTIDGNDWKSVVSGKCVKVRVDIGGRRMHKISKI